MSAMSNRWPALWLVACLVVAGCGTSPTAAPVLDRSPSKTPPAAAAPPAAATPSAAPPATPATTTAPTTPAASPAAPVREAATPAPVTTQKPQEPAAKPVEPAPVVRAAPVAEPETIQKIEDPPPPPYREGDWRPEYHTVKKGDTLYSIALDYGQDYRELAAWNGLENPGVIKIDQSLRLFPPEATATPPGAAPAATSAADVSAAPAAAQAPLKSEPKGRKLPYSEQALAQVKIPVPKSAPTATPAVASAPAKPAVAPVVSTPAEKVQPSDAKLVWEWPVQGKLLYGFGEGSNQKGVGIEGKSGQAVLAGAPGRVVYSGSGLRGYGKLVIIKHNATFLSVYAHNSQILVKEGQSVAKGQKIAEVGSTDSDRAGLHFEIRRFGKPMDPLQFLPGRAS